MELLQDGAVTLFALGAIVMLARRFVSFAKPSGGESACASCPSSSLRPVRKKPSTSVAPPPETRPVTFVRPGAH